MLKQKVKNLPKTFGVYIFKDKFNNIIYIGKAKNLKNRVSSYFNLSISHSNKTQILVKNIFDLDYIVVNSELEALLLENKLIKKNKPKYNINLKDSKTYSYIKITDHQSENFKSKQKLENFSKENYLKIPKIYLTRKINKDGTYFGPFRDTFLAKELIKLVVELFQLVTNSTYSSQSQLNYQIGLAPAKNLENIDIKDYLKKVEMAKKFLKGDTKSILKTLKLDMNKASKEQKYEIAAIKKRQIDAIKHLKEKQKVDLIKEYDQDVIALIKDKKENKAIIELFNISKGVINGKKSFKFDYDENLFEDFIKMYYSQNIIPKEIIVNIPFWKNEENKRIIEKYLSNNKTIKIDLIYPQKGDKNDLIKLAEKNAKLKLGENILLLKIKEMLNLPKIPYVIESFDVSNLSYDYIVAAMVQFVDGLPNKENYRRFEIKSFKEKNDDFKAISEVIFRRYNRLKNEKLDFPDLIIIDGGKGQLNAAIKSLKKIKVQIPIISLAKKDEEIFIIGKEKSLKFDKNSPEMLFIRNIRDTVHKFVISYNRKKRDMRLKKEFKNNK